MFPEVCWGSLRIISAFSFSFFVVVVAVARRVEGSFPSFLFLCSCLLFLVVEGEGKGGKDFSQFVE